MGDVLPDQSAREGFGPDACDEDRVDAPTRDRLQRLYGSVDLFAGMDLDATADGQYEDVKALEVIIGDLRSDRDRLRAENATLRGSIKWALATNRDLAGVREGLREALAETRGSSDETRAT